MNSQLDQVARLIKLRRLNEARQALDVYFDKNPEDPLAWYLLSFAAVARYDKLAAVQRALALNPRSRRLKTRLAQLEAAEDKAIHKPVKGLILVGLGFTFAVIIIVALVLSTSRQHDIPVVPTLAVLGLMPTPLEAAATNAESSNQAQSENNFTASPEQALVVETENQTDFTDGITPIGSESQVSSIEATTPPTFVSVPVVGITMTPQVTSVFTSPTLQDSELATQTPLISSPTPTSAIETEPPPDVATTNSVPINTVINIGIGEMRVVDVVRPGEARIKELGGSVPPAPVNHTWMLIELIVICQQVTTCSVEQSDFQLVSSSDNAYEPAQLNLTPIFGSVTSNGQLWGYMGFIVPSTASGFRLVMTQADQSYIFALEE